MRFSKRLFTSLILLCNAALADETVMETLSLQHRPAAELRNILQPMLEEEDRVVDNGFNLIVKTSPARLEAIRSLIQQLDVELSNLVITVLQNSSKTAAEMNAQAAIGVSSNAIHMHGMMGDTREIGSNQTNQQLRSLEGQPAYIKTGSIRPVENVTVYDNGYGYPAFSSTRHMQEGSSGFEVIPRLAGDQVIIDVSPWSERFQAGGKIETQQTHTVLRAKLGEWVTIAGSDSRDRSDSHSYSGFNHSTRENNLQILLKVERSN